VGLAVAVLLHLRRDPPEAPEPTVPPIKSPGTIVLPAPPAADGGDRAPVRMPPQGAGGATGTADDPYPASADGVRAVVADRQGDLATCYGHWFEDDAEPAEGLMATLLIGGDAPDTAQVTAVVLASATANDDQQEVQECVRAVLAQDHFVRPEGGSMTVTHVLEPPAEP